MSLYSHVTDLLVPSALEIESSARGSEFMQATEIIKDIIFMVGNIFSIVSYYEAQRRRYRKLKRQQQLLLASAPGKQSVSAPPTMMPVILQVQIEQD